MKAYNSKKVKKAFIIVNLIFMPFYLLSIAIWWIFIPIMALEIIVNSIIAKELYTLNKHANFIDNRNKAFEEECIKTGKKTFSISDKQMKELYENKVTIVNKAPIFLEDVKIWEG